MTQALARLLQNGKGAAACLAAKHKALMCDKSFPMMRRLFEAIVRPSFVWVQGLGSGLLSGLGLAAEGHARHPAFLPPPSLSAPQERHARHHFQRVCRKALAGQLVVHGAWVMRQLSLLPEGSLHLDILQDNIADALQPLMSAKWAADIDRQSRDLGMCSPFVSSGIEALDSLGFMSRSAKRREQVWKNLHVSPQTAPSKGAKLCTYHHWFGRPSSLRFELYYELPMGISKLRALVQTWVPYRTTTYRSRLNLAFEKALSTK